MNRYEYLAILTVIFTFAYLFKIWFKVRLFSSVKEALIFYTVVLFFGIIWDSFAIYRGHWTYPESGIAGIRVGLIPIEDYLFILVVSFAVLVVYKVLTKKEKV
jgi:lycopene cyclase domain-containing protein